MESYVIFTESTGDLTPALIEQAQLRVLPMSFNLDGQEYRNWPDGREISSHDYYDKLRAGSACTTSQVTLADYEEAFTPVLEAGQDILYLAFSSGLSGTYQASCVAVGMLQEKFPSRRIACVDSKQASMGEGLIAYLVARKRLAGASFDEALAYAQELAPTVCAWFTVDDLMFLKRGGRLSGAAAVAGTLLGIKPVLHVDDGRPPGGHGEGPRPPAPAWTLWSSTSRPLPATPRAARCSSATGTARTTASTWWTSSAPWASPTSSRGTSAPSSGPTAVPAPSPCSGWAAPAETVFDKL